MSNRITITIDVPEGLVPDVQYAQSGEPPHPAATGEHAPQCEHGAMFFKKGTNKAGKDYAGYFCTADSCKPVWSKA